MTHSSDLHQSVLAGDAAAAVAAARAALEAGMEPMDLATQSIASAMREAGELFEQGEYFVPELLMAARATFARKFGADGYAENASVAVSVARRLVGPE